MLASAGLPQDSYYVGGNRIWDAVSGWLDRTIDYNDSIFAVQENSDIFSIPHGTDGKDNVECRLIEKKIKSTSFELNELIGRGDQKLYEHHWNSYKL